MCGEKKGDETCELLNENLIEKLSPVKPTASNVQPGSPLNLGKTVVPKAKRRCTKLLENLDKESQKVNKTSKKTSRSVNKLISKSQSLNLDGRDEGRPLTM